MSVLLFWIEAMLKFQAHTIWSLVYWQSWGNIRSHLTQVSEASWGPRRLHFWVVQVFLNIICFFLSKYVGLKSIWRCVLGILTNLLPCLWKYFFNGKMQQNKTFLEVEKFSCAQIKDHSWLWTSFITFTNMLCHQQIISMDDFFIIENNKPTLGISGSNT